MMVGSSIGEWIRRDSGLAVEEYVERERGGAWGGGVELAVHAQVERVMIRVFSSVEEQGRAKPIAVFGRPRCGQQGSAEVSLMYRGGAHYDVLVASPPGGGVGEARRRRRCVA